MKKPGAKGPAFERLICKQLSLWWTQDLPEPRDDIFWRTAGSGARATKRSQKNQATKNQYGDICAVDPIGQPLLDLLTIELKKGYSQSSLADLLDKPAEAALQRYENWIARAERDSKLAGSRGWMIIFQRNRRAPCVLLSSTIVFEDLFDYANPPFPHFVFSVSACVAPSWYYAFPLSEFLAKTTPDIMRSLLGDRS